MAVNYTGPLTRQRLEDIQHETSSSTSITAATINSNELRDKVKILVHELQTNTVNSPHHWGWLHLRIKDLSLKECQTIVEGLKVNTNNVIWLDISPINISFQGLACIIDSLKTNTCITELHLCGKPDNDLYDEEDDDNYLIPLPAKSLAEVLQVNKSITNLTIANSSMSDDDMKIVIHGLKMNITLTQLQLASNPNLTIQSAIYLKELIESTKTLKEIRLEEISNVDDQYIILIASAMKINQSIKEAMINSCQIRDKGAAVLSEMLAVNQALKNLNLSDNLITDTGAKFLAEGLKHNSTLERFSIRMNQFTKTSDGGEALFKAKSAAIHYLDLD